MMRKSRARAETTEVRASAQLMTAVLTLINSGHIQAKNGSCCCGEKGPTGCHTVLTLAMRLCTLLVYSPSVYSACTHYSLCSLSVYSAVLAVLTLRLCLYPLLTVVLQEEYDAAMQEEERLRQQRQAAREEECEALEREENEARKKVRQPREESVRREATIGDARGEER